MKRSTIFFIIILIMLLAIPMAFLVYTYSLMPDLGKLMEFFDENDDPLYQYTVVVTTPDTVSADNAYIAFSTYKGNVDESNPVNFINSMEGCAATLVGDTIFISIENLMHIEEDGHILSVELPYESKLFIANNVPSITMRVEGADLHALRTTSQGDVVVYSSNLGGMISTDTTAMKRLTIDNSNVGGVKVNGVNTKVFIDDSNIGALVVRNESPEIGLTNSNIGSCAWNKACNDKAVIKNCAIVTTLSENSIDVTIDDVADTTSSIFYLSHPDSINVSDKAIHVNSGSGDKVDISTKGVFVESAGGDTVSVSFDGIKVVSGKDEVVTIDTNGIKIIQGGEEVVSVDVNEE